MKNFIWMFLTVTVITFASCGNKTAPASVSNTDTVAMDSTVDSIAVDSL